MSALQYVRVAVVVLLAFVQIAQIEGGVIDDYLDGYVWITLTDYNDKDFLLFFSDLMKVASQRIRATPPKDWFSTSMGEPCPRPTILDYLSNAPANSTALGFIPLCSAIKAPRDVGKVRVPIFAIPGNMNNATLDPPISFGDVAKSLDDIATYELSTLLRGLGDKCDQSTLDLKPTTGSVTNTVEVYFISLCNLLGLDWGLTTKFLVFV